MTLVCPGSVGYATNIMRLFVAAPVPETVKEKLLETARSLAPAPARWVGAENLHLTLLWLGEVAEPEELLASVPEQLPQPFVATALITHIGAGKKLGQIWAYVHPETPLLNLQAGLKKLLASPEEDRAFTPHITLARGGTEGGQLGADRAFQTTFKISELGGFPSGVDPRKRPVSRSE